MTDRFPIALVGGLPREIPTTDRVKGDASIMSVTETGGATKAMGDAFAGKHPLNTAIKQDPSQSEKHPWEFNFSNGRQVYQYGTADQVGIYDTTLGFLWRYTYADGKSYLGNAEVWTKVNFDPNNYAALNGYPIFGGVQTKSNFPKIQFIQTGNSAVDETHWDFLSYGNSFFGRILNDAEDSATNWVTVARSAMNVTGISFPVRPAFAGNAAWDAGNFDALQPTFSTKSATPNGPTPDGSRGTVKVRPAAGIFTGIDTRQTLSGRARAWNSELECGAYTNPAIGSTNSKIYAPHLISVDDTLDNGSSDGSANDPYSQPANAGHTVSAVLIQHRFGDLTGVRETLRINSIFTQASKSWNYFRNYVGFRNTLLADATDGGVAKASGSTNPFDGAKGTFFSQNPEAYVTTNCQNAIQVAISEGNVGIFGNGSARMLFGYSVVRRSDKQADVIDAAFTTGAIQTDNGNITPFKDQFLVGDFNGGNPCDPNGTIMRHTSFTGVAASVNTIFDFGVLGCNTILKAPNTALAPGVWTMAAPNFGMEIGSQNTANAPYLDFHTSGSAVDYDVRLQANGGNATAGNGNFAIVAGLTQTRQLTPLQDNAFPLGAANLRWSTVYAGTGTINTSDASLKKVLGSPDDALLDAVEAVQIQVFQYLESVAVKGDAARIHVGILAQDLQAAMRARGLDPSRYAVWCEDPVTEMVEEDCWTERQEVEMVKVETIETVVLGDRAERRAVTKLEKRGVFRSVPLFDETGERVMTKAIPARIIKDEETGAEVEIPAVEPTPVSADVPVMERVNTPRKVERPVLDADGKPVTRLGIRYGDLAMLMIAALRRAPPKS